MGPSLLTCCRGGVIAGEVTGERPLTLLPGQVLAVGEAGADARASGPTSRRARARPSVPPTAGWARSARARRCRASPHAPAGWRSPPATATVAASLQPLRASCPPPWPARPARCPPLLADLALCRRALAALAWRQHRPNAAPARPRPLTHAGCEPRHDERGALGVGELAHGWLPLCLLHESGDLAFIAASVARPGAWRIGRWGPIFWPAGS
jgi:hypothetical protein